MSATVKPLIAPVRIPRPAFGELLHHSVIGFRVGGPRHFGEPLIGGFFASGSTGTTATPRIESLNAASTHQSGITLPYAPVAILVLLLAPDKLLSDLVM